MSQFVKSIFTPTNLLGVGTGIMGLIGNASANRERNKLIQAAVARQRYLQSLTPEQVTTGIRGLESPLSGGLTKGVGNLVQAAMQERGLTGSPTIWGDVLAQALAPYMLQAKELASNNYFRMLGAGGTGTELLNAASMYQPSSTAQIWRSLLQRFIPSSGGASSPAPSGLTVESPDPGGGLTYSRPLEGWWDIISNPGNYGLSPAAAGGGG